MQAYDVIIIGAGHNGLVCGAYLLKAGYSVLLLEKRSVPGGAATTEEAMPKEAPGFKFDLGAIDHEFIHLGPVAELGERLGAYKGNYYHIDMTLDQMVFFRPLPELANYKTPIDGLFLTGAGTHPGGSISGMPGRNCARVFLHSQQPITQKLKEARDSIKSTVESVFKLTSIREHLTQTLPHRDIGDGTR